MKIRVVKHIGGATHTICIALLFTFKQVTVSERQDGPDLWAQQTGLSNIRHLHGGGGDVENVYAPWGLCIVTHLFRVVIVVVVVVIVSQNIQINKHCVLTTDHTSVIISDVTIWKCMYVFLTLSFWQMSSFLHFHQMFELVLIFWLSTSKSCNVEPSHYWFTR